MELGRTVNAFMSVPLVVDASIATEKGETKLVYGGMLNAFLQRIVFHDQEDLDAFKVRFAEYQAQQADTTGKCLDCHTDRKACTSDPASASCQPTYYNEDQDELG